MLTLVGGEVVEYPYGELGRVVSRVYFLSMGAMILWGAMGWSSWRA